MRLSPAYDLASPNHVGGSNLDHPMAEKPVAKHRGSGRAAFIARLSAIRAEIAAGDFLVTVHNRHKDSLGITYSAFRKLVQRYAEDAKPLRRAPLARPHVPALTKPLPPLPPAETKPAPQPSPEGQPAHARHEPAPTRRTFNHDGVERPDDRRRLLGED